MRTLRRCVRTLLIGLLAVLGPETVMAQSWPTKPIRLVIPFAAGGAQDTLARAFTAELGTALGQNVLVENRPGASGTVATGYVARSAPDGYTLILSAASHTINGTLYAKLDYHPLKDFSAIAAVGSTGYILAGRGDAPFATVAELITYGRANPGKLNYATAGPGSAAHLSAAYMFSLAGVSAVAIPTKGQNEAMTEVVAGRSDVMIGTNNILLPFMNDKRVRILGVTTPKASGFVPGIAPIAASLPGYQFDSWFGILGPAGIPKPIAERLNAEVMKLVARADIRDRLTKQGVEPLTMPSDEFAAFLGVDFERMAKVVKAAGARVE